MKKRNPINAPGAALMLVTLTAAFFLMTACGEPPAGPNEDGGTPLAYSTLFEDDFERPDSGSLGTDWYEIENQGVLPNAVYLQSGKAILQGGQYQSGSNQAIAPQAYYFCDLNGPHSRITIDLDQTLSTELFLWVNIHYSYIIDSTTYGSSYSLTATKDNGGDAFSIGIQNSADSNDRIYDADPFPVAAGDSLSVIIDKDGVDLTLTLIDTTTGARKSVALPGSPYFNTTNSVVLSGGGFDGIDRLNTAIESFKIETAD